MCVSGACPNADAQFREANEFFSFWRLLRAAESVPKDYYIREAHLSLQDLELLAVMDASYANELAEIQKQKAQQNASHTVTSAPRGPRR